MPSGIRTSTEDLEFDLIVYATGFDGATGAFDRIEFAGTNGQKLRDKWADGPVTNIGLQVAGFPNLFIIAGPSSGTVGANFPPGIETAVNWISELVQHAIERDLTRVESTREAELEWTQHVEDVFSQTLFRKAKSWVAGISPNVPGRDKPRAVAYMGGAPRYRKRLNQVAANGYAGFRLD